MEAFDPILGKSVSDLGHIYRCLGDCESVKPGYGKSRYKTCSTNKLCSKSCRTLVLFYSYGILLLSCYPAEKAMDTSRPGREEFYIAGWAWSLAKEVNSHSVVDERIRQTGLKSMMELILERRSKVSVPYTNWSCIGSVGLEKHNQSSLDMNLLNGLKQAMAESQTILSWA